MTSKHRFIKQNFQLGGLRIVGAISSLLVNLMLARLFQAEDVGKYFVSLSLVIFTAQLATMGSEKYLVKKLSGSYKEHENKKNLSSVFFLVFLGSLISYYLYQLVFIKIFSVDDSLNLFQVYTMALFFVISAIFQVNNKAPIGLFIQYILQPIIFISLILIFSTPLIQLYSISFTFCLLISSLYLFNSGFLQLGKFQVSDLTYALKETLPYFSMMLVGLLVTHLNLPLSSLWLDDSDLAVVGIINRFINILFFTVTGTRMLLLPLLSRAIASNNTKEVSQLSYWGRILPMVIVAIGITIFTFFGEQIMQLFGDVYANYHYLLVLSSLLLLPAAYWSGSQSYLIANNNIGLVNLSAVITATLILSLLLILTPLYGIWAAVLVVVGGKTFYSMLTAYFTSKLK